MKNPFVYRSWSIRGEASKVADSLAGLLLRSGYVQNGSSGGVCFFCNPIFTFSSRRPLSCISRLSLDVKQNGATSRVTVGATFTKIRYFTITLMLLVCGAAPVAVSIMKYGRPDIPPPAWLGIPVGFMLHYHVRWRIFRAIRMLVMSVGKD